MNTHLLTLAAVIPGASLPDSPTFWETIQFQLTGLSIVMTALAGLWFMSAMVGWLFKQVEQRRKPVVTPNPEPAAVDAPAAVIAAAVAAIIDEPHRIVSMAPATGNNPWTSHGREQIFSSHKVPRRS